MLSPTFAYVMPASSNAFAPADIATLEISFCPVDDIPTPAMCAFDRDMVCDINTDRLDHWRFGETWGFSVSANSSD